VANSTILNRPLRRERRACGTDHPIEIAVLVNRVRDDLGVADVLLPMAGSMGRPESEPPLIRKAAKLLRRAE
jgi:hypothetical protein